MTNRAKSILLLTATLAVGFVLGALASGNMHDKRHQTLLLTSPQQRIILSLEAMLGPDEMQRKAIKQIIDSRLSSMVALFEHVQEGTYASLDSIEQDLLNVLRPDQQAVLREQIGALYRNKLRKQIRRLGKALNLTHEQMRRATQLIRRTDLEGRAAYTGSDLTLTELGQSTRLRSETVRREFEALLTPEQKRTYEEIRPLLRPIFLR